MRNERVNDLARLKDPYWIDEGSSFLLSVWAHLTTEERIQFLIVAARHGITGKWVEYGFKLDDADCELREFLRKHPRKEWDLYWCPNPFRRPRRIKAYAMSTPFGWCDIDRAPWTFFRPRPNLVWGTSPGRTQGLWLWHRFETPGRAEAYSRALELRNM
jgi:hypothetical protein